MRTSPISGDAARYGAFSIAVRNIQFDIVNDTRASFYAQITAADLTEISLTEYPHLDQARVVNRLRPSANVEFYGAAQQYFAKLTQIVMLLQKEVHP